MSTSKSLHSDTFSWQNSTPGRNYVGSGDKGLKKNVLLVRTRYVYILLYCDSTLNASTIGRPQNTWRGGAVKVSQREGMRRGRMSGTFHLPGGGRQQPSNAAPRMRMHTPRTVEGCTSRFSDVSSSREKLLRLCHSVAKCKYRLYSILTYKL